MASPRLPSAKLLEFEQTAHQSGFLGRGGVQPPADVKFLDRRAKTQKPARWNSDQSESEELPSSDEESVLDPSEKATSPRCSSSVPSEAGRDSNKEENGGEPSEREKKFGRKARVKAQVSQMQRG